MLLYLTRFLGARLDLLALAEITYIKSRTARIFWENGYKTVGAVAAADPKELLSVLLLVSFILATRLQLLIHILGPTEEASFRLGG